MPDSKPHLPYLFHISTTDMEAGKPCRTRAFHIFHIFHICFSRVHVARTHAHAHTRAPALCVIIFLVMEDMEDMEEGHRTRVSGFHISAISHLDMEHEENQSWI